MAGTNVKIIKANAPKVVPMYDMKHGQIGVVVDSIYIGAVVKACNHLSLPKTVHVFALDGSDYYWSSDKPGGGGGIQVEIIEAGSTIEIVVPNLVLAENPGQPLIA